MPNKWTDERDHRRQDWDRQSREVRDPSERGGPDYGQPIHRSSEDRSFSGQNRGRHDPYQWRGEDDDGGRYAGDRDSAGTPNGERASPTDPYRWRQPPEPRSYRSDGRAPDYDRAFSPGREFSTFGFGHDVRGAAYDDHDREESRRHDHDSYTPNVREGRGEGGRTWWDRTRDQVSSMFGDHVAERRRQWDVQTSHRGRGPKGYRRSDERITEDVHERLTQDHLLDASGVQVAVSAGEVTLTGSVSDRYAKHRAERLVEDVSGVDHVQNNLRVARGSVGQGDDAADPGPGGKSGIG